MISDKLNQLGMQKQVNNVVLSINRAAEDASISAKTIFIEAITNMSIRDAIGIVKGGKTSGTDYLKKTSNSSLVIAFDPIIRASLQKVNATKYWKKVVSTYNQIPFVQNINPELESYVTQKAIEGLFFMIAKEEVAIRKNSRNRT